MDIWRDGTPAPDCTDGHGYRTDHPAHGWLLAPDGRRIVAQCRMHAQMAIDEYVEKLGEQWSFADEAKEDG